MCFSPFACNALVNIKLKDMALILCNDRLALQSRKFIVLCLLNVRGVVRPHAQMFQMRLVLAVPQTVLAKTNCARVRLHQFKRYAGWTMMFAAASQTPTAYGQSYPKIGRLATHCLESIGVLQMAFASL